GRLVGDLFFPGGFQLEAVAVERHESDRNDVEIDRPLLVGEALSFQVTGVITELAPALGAVNDHDGIELVVAELSSILVETLDGHLTVEFVLIVVERNRALGLPGKRLDLVELLRAAQGTDRLSKDRLCVLLVSPGWNDNENHRQTRTKKPSHEVTSF